MRDETRKIFEEWRADLENELAETEKMAVQAAADLPAAVTAFETADAIYRELLQAVTSIKGAAHWMLDRRRTEVWRARCNVSGDLTKARLTVESAQSRCADIKAALAHLDEIAPVIPAKAEAM